VEDKYMQKLPDGTVQPSKDLKPTLMHQGQAFIDESQAAEIRQGFVQGTLSASDASAYFHSL